MGKLDLVPYEAAIDKLCVSCVTDIAKELKRATAAVDKRISELAKKIQSVPIPQNLSEEELKEIPDLIDQTLAADSKKLKNLAEPNVTFTIDVKKKKLRLDGWGFEGSVAELYL